MKKANEAADTAVAQELNKALASYSAANGNPEDFDEVIVALEAAGYDILALNSKADGNFYAWDKANNQIVYLTKNKEVIYQNTAFDAANLVSVATSEKVVVDAIAAGGNVTVATDIVLDAKVPAILVTEDTTVDLGSATITVPNDKSGDGVFCVKDGTLTLKGDGVVNSVGNNDYNIAVWADGGNVVIDGGTYTNVGAGDDDHYDLIYVKNGGTVTINGGKFIAETPAWTLNSHDTYTGTIIVKGGEFCGFNPETDSNDATVYVADGFKVEEEVRDGVIWYVVVAE